MKKNTVKPAYYGIITDAKYLCDYLIEVTFFDHSVKVVDLEDFFKLSKHKLVHKFYPLEQFKQFRIERGALAWGDNECDINPVDMYEGVFDAQLEHA
jgi:hypothetical protein